MNSKNLIKWLLGIIVFLLLLNVLSLGQIWKTHRMMRHNRPPIAQNDLRGMADLKKQLQLSERQLKMLRESRQAHRQRTKDHHEQMREYKKLLFEEATSPQPDEYKIENYQDEICKLQKEFDEANLKHFREILENLDPQQQKRFKPMLRDAIHHP